MACTAAVETVVLSHLEHQIRWMTEQGDHRAAEVVSAIVADEEEHRQTGEREAQDSFLYRPLCAVVGWATRFVIWSGLKL